MMAKRLICMLLATLMLLVVFTSCSGSGDAMSETMNEASRYTSTLNLWIIAEDGMDADQAAAVNEAINKITKSKFRTQLNVKYVSEAEYYSSVETAFVDYKAALAEAKKNGTTLSSTSSTEETILNEYGVPELKYPTAHDAQVDILFIGNAEKYRTYAENGWIMSVDGLLEDTGVQLAYYVNNYLLSTAKYKNLLYGVPSNSTLGDYTFVAVNEALANEYLYTATDFKSDDGGVSLLGTEAMDFMEQIYARLQAGTDATPIYPLYSDNGDIDVETLHYWSFDVDSTEGACIQTPDQFSLFGGYVYETYRQGSTLSFNNLLLDSLYTGTLATQAYIKSTENYLTTDASSKSAFRVVHGGYEKIAELEAQGYTVLTAKAPRITDECVFDSMFAIGADTAEEVRAMEIITYINTNSELRNLLQYGIEGENYTLESVEIDDETYYWAKEAEGNGYKMDIRKTGNIFVAYPNSAEAIAEWEFGKQQNLQAVTYPTLSLYFNLVDYKLNATSIRVMNAVSAKFEEVVFPTFVDRAAVESFFNGDGDPNNKDCPKDYATDTLGLAEFLLAKCGTVTYTEGGATVTVTAQALADAITCMGTSSMNSAKDALQSPNALYADWLANSGVNG